MPVLGGAGARVGNGVAVTNRPTGSSWQAVQFGNDTWVAVLNSSSTSVWSRDNGASWSSASMGVTGSFYFGAYGAGRFIATQSTTANLHYSTSGTAWTSTTLPSSGEWLAAGDDGSTFGAIKNNSTAYAYTTNNGTSYTSVTLPVTGAWNAIAYGNGTWVAAEEASGTGRKTLYSTDGGATWGTGTTLPTGVLNCYYISYGNGVFFACPISGGTAAKSADGVTWSAVTLPSTVLNWRAMSFGDGLFFVAASSSTSAYYTADLVNWTPVTNTAATSWSLSSYGNGRFMVGSNTTTTSIFPVSHTSGRPVLQAVNRAAVF